MQLALLITGLWKVEGLKIYKTEFSDVVLLEMPGCNLGRNKQIRNRLVKCSTIANLG